MAAPHKRIDVLIVGAGPAGLMAAVQLLRHGVRPTIIDRKPGPDKAAKAMMLHARSLEIFRQLGMADALLDRGRACYGTSVLNSSGATTLVDFAQLKNPSTPFPFMLGIGQDAVEQMLITRLTDNACPIMWDTELTTIRQDDHAAQVTLTRHGSREQWTCDWVIGADGAHSGVRDGLGIPTETRGQRQTFLMADLQLDDVSGRNVRLIFSKSGFIGFYPLHAPGRFRVLFSEGRRPGTAAAEQLPYEVINAEMTRALGVALPDGTRLRTEVWVSQSQTTSLFDQQRCFLIGDAAHTYSPVGALGINTGFTDALNLGWKLAGVLRGNADARALRSYTPERRFLAQPSLAFTDRLFGLLTSPAGIPRFIRDRLFVNGLDFIIRRKWGLQWLFNGLAQLSPDYRKSVLSAHHAHNRRVCAGDRLPFVLLYNEQTKTATDLHRWCEKPGFILMILGTVGHHQLHIIGRWMRQKYPREMHLYYLPYSPRNQQVFDVFELPPTGTKIILIRPDMHIGYMNDILNVNLIDTYMEEIIGWNYVGHLPENS